MAAAAARGGLASGTRPDVAGSAPPAESDSEPLLPQEHIRELRGSKFGINDSGVGNGSRGESKYDLVRDLARSTQLLARDLNDTDDHFILELIQNAQDNTYPDGVEPSLNFVLLKKHVDLPKNVLVGHGGAAPDDSAKRRVSALVVLNNECGLKPEHVDALSGVGRSNKQERKAGAHGLIGEKGVGFKSVFKVATAAIFVSNGYQFSFSDHTRDDSGLAHMVPQWLDTLPPELAQLRSEHLGDKGTMLVLVLRNEDPGKGADPYGVVDKGLRKLHPSVLLTLSKLHTLRVSLDGRGAHWAVQSRMKESMLDDMHERSAGPGGAPLSLAALADDTSEGRAAALGGLTIVELQSKSGDAGWRADSRFVKFERVFSVEVGSTASGEERRSGVTQRAVSLMLPIPDADARPEPAAEAEAAVPWSVFAYLPCTGVRSHLPFIIQADFLVSASRETILTEKPWNSWVLSTVDTAAQEMFDALVSTHRPNGARAHPLKAWMDPAIAIVSMMDFDRNHVPTFFQDLVFSLGCKLRTTACIPDALTGALHRPAELCSIRKPGPTKELQQVLQPNPNVQFQESLVAFELALSLPAGKAYSWVAVIGQFVEVPAATSATLTLLANDAEWMEKLSSTDWARVVHWAMSVNSNGEWDFSALLAEQQKQGGARRLLNVALRTHDDAAEDPAAAADGGEPQAAAAAAAPGPRFRGLCLPEIQIHVSAGVWKDRKQEVRVSPSSVRLSGQLRALRGPLRDRGLSFVRQSDWDALRSLLEANAPDSTNRLLEEPHVTWAANARMSPLSLAEIFRTTSDAILTTIGEDASLLLTEAISVLVAPVSSSMEWKDCIESGFPLPVKTSEGAIVSPSQVPGQHLLPPRSPSGACSWCRVFQTDEEAIAMGFFILQREFSRTLTSALGIDSRKGTLASLTWDLPKAELPRRGFAAELLTTLSTESASALLEWVAEHRIPPTDPVWISLVETAWLSSDDGARHRPAQLTLATPESTDLFDGTDVHFLASIKAYDKYKDTLVSLGVMKQPPAPIAVGRLVELVESRAARASALIHKLYEYLSQRFADPNRADDAGLRVVRAALANRAWIEQGGAWFTPSACTFASEAADFTQDLVMLDSNRISPLTQQLFVALGVSRTLSFDVLWAAWQRVRARIRAELPPAPAAAAGAAEPSITTVTAASPRGIPGDLHSSADLLLARLVRLLDVALRDGPAAGGRGGAGLAGRAGAAAPAESLDPALRDPKAAVDFTKRLLFDLPSLSVVQQSKKAALLKLAVKVLPAFLPESEAVPLPLWVTVPSERAPRGFNDSNSARLALIGPQGSLYAPRGPSEPNPSAATPGEPGAAAASAACSGGHAHEEVDVAPVDLAEQGGGDPPHGSRPLCTTWFWPTTKAPKPRGASGRDQAGRFIAASDFAIPEVVAELRLIHPDEIGAISQVDAAPTTERMAHAKNFFDQLIAGRDRRDDGDAGPGAAQPADGARDRLAARESYRCTGGLFDDIAARCGIQQFTVELYIEQASLHCLHSQRNLVRALRSFIELDKNFRPWSKTFPWRSVAFLDNRGTVRRLENPDAGAPDAGIAPEARADVRFKLAVPGDFSAADPPVASVTAAFSQLVVKRGAPGTDHVVVKNMPEKLNWAALFSSEEMEELGYVVLDRLYLEEHELSKLPSAMDAVDLATMELPVASGLPSSWFPPTLKKSIVLSKWIAFYFSGEPGVQRELDFDANLPLWVQLRDTAWLFADQPHRDGPGRVYRGEELHGSSANTHLLFGGALPCLHLDITLPFTVQRHCLVASRPMLVTIASRISELAREAARGSQVRAKGVALLEKATFSLYVMLGEEYDSDGLGLARTYDVEEQRPEARQILSDAPNGRWLFVGGEWRSPAECYIDGDDELAAIWPTKAFLRRCWADHLPEAAGSELPVPLLKLVKDLGVQRQPTLETLVQRWLGLPAEMQRVSPRLPSATVRWLWENLAEQMLSPSRQFSRVRTGFLENKEARVLTQSGELSLPSNVFVVAGDEPARLSAGPRSTSQQQQDFAADACDVSAAAAAQAAVAGGATMASALFGPALRVHGAAGSDCFKLAAAMGVHTIENEARCEVVHDGQLDDRLVFTAAQKDQLDAFASDVCGMQQGTPMPPSQAAELRQATQNLLDCQIVRLKNLRYDIHVSESIRSEALDAARESAQAEVRQLPAPWGQGAADDPRRLVGIGEGEVAWVRFCEHAARTIVSDTSCWVKLDQDAKDWRRSLIRAFLQHTSNASS